MLHAQGIGENENSVGTMLVTPSRKVLDALLKNTHTEINIYITDLGKCMWSKYAATVRRDYRLIPVPISRDRTVLKYYGTHTRLFLGKGTTKKGFRIRLRTFFATLPKKA